MIDPTDVTKFDRTDNELEEWWLFSCVVAGKTAHTQARLLDKFLKIGMLPEDGGSPFKAIQNIDDEGPGRLLEVLQLARLGQYTRLERCFRESLSLDLRNDSVEALEKVHGIGPKTARMFVMHSRPNQRVAALDTHILKHLAANGHTVPKATPSSTKKYRELEEAFLALVDASGKTTADYDLEVWRAYARG